MNYASYIALIPLLPLTGFVLLGIFGRRYLKNSSGIIGTGLLLVSAVLSLYTAYNYFFVDGKVGDSYQTITAIKFTWLSFSENVSIDMGIMLDPISVMMLVVVTFVSLMVHIFSLGYMKGEERFPTYYAFLGLFTFSMLGLVVSSNLFQIYMFWELVGVSSYLLIGYYYDRPSAVAASKKAFIVTRFADLGFLVGILILAFYGETLDFKTLIQNLTSHQSSQFLAITTASFVGVSALTWGLTLVFIGGAGKSAMFPLHIWLPDAMEGPTPVSALIHAATMVTAGVFMVARLSPLFELAPAAQTFVVFIGATTALFAATIGLVQNDIKRIVAYSTCSQLGYMFVAMGVGAYSVGMYHLFTHAFFKALLFLGSGSVIQAMHHEQDIRIMGGLKDRILYTYIVMVIGTLALTGFPLTAGYFSKDAIIEAAFVGKNPMALYAFICTVAAALLTSFYSWRLIFKTFHGEPHDRLHWRDAHESPMVMLIPLGFLAAGSVLAGLPFKEIFAGRGVEGFFRESLTFAKTNHVLEEMHHVPLQIAILPTVMMVIGFVIAWHFYIRRPDIPVELARQHDVLYRFLLNKWYFDELYDFIFVRPTKWLGRLLWKSGDGWVIDGFGPDGVSARVLDVTRNVVRLQTGYLYHYAFAMLIGAAAFITWFMFATGSR